MTIRKIFWGFRAFIYGLFTTYKMPGYIGKPIYISNLKKMFFGKRVRIYPGLRAEIIKDTGSIEIGENTSIGQNFHIVSNNEKLVIGKNVVISGNVFITNCDHSYDKKDIHIFDQELVTKHTEIGDNCFIGYGAVIQAGTILGKQCIVGANAVVRGKFKDYSVIAGAPAKVIKNIS